MIASVRGRVKAIEADAVVVDVGGVGLRVRVPATTLRELEVADTVELHTHLYVRESEIALYGAPDTRTLKAFELLLGVTGVGPRLAMAILGTHDVDALTRYVETAAVDPLTLVTGVGRKTAQRIVVDLQGKLGAALRSDHLAVVPKDDEALLALTALGYSRSEALAALAGAGFDWVVEDRIRHALRSLGSP